MRKCAVCGDDIPGGRVLCSKRECRSEYHVRVFHTDAYSMTAGRLTRNAPGYIDDPEYIAVATFRWGKVTVDPVTEIDDDDW